MFKVIITDSIYNRVLSTEESKDIEARSYLYKLLKQQKVECLTAEETNAIKSHPEHVMKSPSSLFILDIPVTEALAIQRRYGVMCLSGERTNISQLIDVDDFHTPNEGEALGRGWDSVLDSVEKLPSNALLLTDRYLFASRDKDAGDGLANVQSILNELLPLEFSGGDYHVTVVFCFDKMFYTYSFSEIANKLNNIAQQSRRTYPIMMEVFGISEDSDIYDKMHSRRIISNYYLVEATHKLAAFNKNLGTAQQLLIPLALFTKTSLNGGSSSPLDSINQTIADFQDFYKDILSQKIKSVNYHYALNGMPMPRCTGIRNRLFKMS